MEKKNYEKLNRHCSLLIIIV